VSFMVRRTRPHQGPTSWTGPIRSERQANREAAAWASEGYIAEVLDYTPEVKKLVRAWQKAKAAR
jgi:hypothetical protein